MSARHRSNALRRTVVTVVSTVAMTAALIAMPVAASAAPPVTPSTAGLVYDNIPSPQPGNVSSEAFEAQSASEFGGDIQMTTSSVTDPVVTVLMSSWGCQSGRWTDNNCSTTPGATFSEPITLNIYVPGSATAGSPPGALLLTSTATFAIPFRPSADPVHCVGLDAGKWYSAADAKCYNGFATPITYHLSGHLSTNKVVVSLAYNTTHYGYHPYGEATACFTSSGGCGYDSLNVGVWSPPSVGSDPRPNDAYLNSSSPSAYCGPNSGVGSFVADPGCWTGFQPAIAIQQGSVRTVLTANPSIAKVLPGLVIYLKLSAKLTTSAGNPVFGEPIVFTAAGQHVCTALTDSNGNAKCDGFLTGVVKSVIGLGYYASFAGDGVLQPATDHGPLIQIL